MNIAILGLGLQGASAYKYWHRAGNRVTVCDSREDLELPQDTTSQLGPNYLKDLDRFDLIVRSPSVHPRDIVAANSPEILAKVTSSTNEFMRVCPTKNIIGVTGTKGKGTTAILIAKMLEASGRRVHLGGNIGTPPLELLDNAIQPADWVVLELANFQLIDLRYSPHIATCLLVVPEHLDWHADMDEYMTAKSQLFAHQNPQDIAVYFAENETSHQIASASPGAKITYYAQPGAYVSDENIVIDNQIICSVKDLKLVGVHNWQNACAAATVVWQIDQQIAPIRSVLTTFSGFAHRLELIRTIDNVSYYNDSYATTPEAAIAALEAFPESKVVILGGSDKHATYDELAEAVIDNNVRAVVVIGETASAIASALRNKGFNTILPGGTTMTEIVQLAHDTAKSGDVVLLSPGCASFGLFKNADDRGNQFHTAVGAL